MRKRSDVSVYVVKINPYGIVARFKAWLVAKVMPLIPRCMALITQILSLSLLS